MEAIFQRNDLKTILVILLSLLASVNCTKKRPFYIIGHQVNGIEDVKEYLDKGSNVLESDIRFYSNGSVNEIYHGPPCESYRNCLHKANLKDFLEYVRDITDPGKADSYYQKMVVQYFDMFLDGSDNTTESGRDMARHVFDYLWSVDGSRKQEVRVLLNFDAESPGDFLVGFLAEFRGKEDRLRDVGYDGGQNAVSDIRETFHKLGISKNVWLGGYGERLKEELADRDSENRFIDKVYGYTTDQKEGMRKLLRLGVDGMHTNRPHKLARVLKEPEFAADFKLAGIDEDPFEYFNGGN